MNSRLTIQDLAGLLAERTGRNRRDSELFLREFVAVVSEGVFTDRIAKVKGFGTFKIVLVEKRESIHVNTGERFTIPSHYKISFLPDKDLKELVNKPFSFFETEEISEGVDFSDVDISKDEEEKEADDEKIVETPVVESSVQESPEIEDTEEMLKDETSTPSRWGGAWVMVGVVALVAAVCFFLYQNRDFFPWMKKSEPSVLVGSSLPGSAEMKLDTILAEKDEPQETPIEEEVKRDTVAAQAKDTVESKSQVLAKVKIEPGSRLTLISLEYYGSKIFWVYLYEFNKSEIKDPNNIPVGTEIQVPAPEVYGIDKNSRASVDKAALRQAEILSGGQSSNSQAR